MPTLFNSIASPITPRPQTVVGQAPIAPTPQISPSGSDSIDNDADIEDESDWDSDDDDEDGDSFTASETDSSGSDDEEQTEEQHRAEREARAVERQRVLEAAGLIITKTDRKPPPRPARRKSIRKRRPAPEVPQRRRRSKHDTMHETLSPDLDGRDSSLRLDDAYERYENFKQSSTSMNRLSMASVDTSASIPSSAPSPSPSLAILRSPSTEQEGRSYSNFLHFFGRKTPGNDGEARVMPVISGPIPIGEKEPSSPSMGDGNFGTVC